MKGLNDTKMKLSAAAIAFALSAGTGFAQQQGGAASRSGQEAQQHGASPSQSQQRSGQRAERQNDAPQQTSSQQRQGDSQLDSVVQMHSDLGTFVEALEAAGLVEELAGSTKYTIFAPTNQAFDSMRQDVSELLKPENRQDLVALLRNHIVADDVDPQMARRLQSAQTLDGDTISISAEGDKLMIGEASVVTPNIQVQGSNLRIYAIDKVLGEGRQVASAGSERDRG